MELFEGAILYIAQNQSAFWEATRQHLALSGSALGISILICLVACTWIAHRDAIAQVVINVFNALRVVPSLAILFLALPYLGLGTLPSLVALTVLAIPPILINTYTGIRTINPAVVEAAYGMGMSPRQVFKGVELPLAAPAILAGIRIAAVEVIASATLAAFIGGGGLGIFITRGFALFEPRIMLVGAVPVSLLALGAEVILGGAQRLLFQAGMEGR